MIVENGENQNDIDITEFKVNNKNYLNAFYSSKGYNGSGAALKRHYDILYNKNSSDMNHIKNNLSSNDIIDTDN